MDSEGRLAIDLTAGGRAWYFVSGTVCRNLTEAAAHAKLDPVVGRRAETNRLLHILCRRSKNNPCLIGEAGVGKTAIVEGLCQKIAAKAVPTELMQKQIFALEWRVRSTAASLRRGSSSF